MKDLRNISNPFALAGCLLAVCAVSTFAMALTASKTAVPIRISAERDTAGILSSVLPEYDNNPITDAVEIEYPDGHTGKLFIAKKNSAIVGYATVTDHPGYGGPVKGITGFLPDGSIHMVMIMPGHSETPGIGTKVTDRVYRRTISDILRGISSEEGIPPNETLDSYCGKKVTDKPWSIRKTHAKGAAPSASEVDFVSGATYTSTAVYNLVWDAANAVSKYLASQHDGEDPQ